jgi:DNA polymerase III alpha subunit
MEHDEDGTRWLVTDSAASTWCIPRAEWARAVADGAAGVLLYARDGFSAAIAPHVDAQAQERPDGTLFLGKVTFAEFPQKYGAPTYHEVLDQLEAKQDQLRADPPEAAAGFVHLHTHSEFSPLDGLSRMDEIVREVVKHGQTAVGITDHGTVAGHPELQRAADKAGLKPVFGIEANLTDERKLRGPDVADDPRFQGHTSREGKPITPAQALQNHYWHLCLFAENDTGLRNIWAASTESFRDGFYGRPRMDWDTLARFSEGVIASTGCLRGPVAVAIKVGDLELARQRLTQLMDIYPGRLYVELQPNDLPEQRLVNETMIDLAREFGLPLIATVDSHFPTADDAHAHDVWIACQTDKDVQDEGDIFSEHLDLYVMGEDQVRAGLAYLGEDVVEEAIANTTALADRCNARIEGDTATPSFTGDPKEDERRLHDLCEKNWERLPADQPGAGETYRDRYRREMDLLKDKGFCCPPGTQITMADGTLKPIEEIREGDKVLTHDGIGTVYTTMQRDLAGDLISMRSAAEPSSLRLTGEHPVLLDGKGWTEAKDVRPGDHTVLAYRTDVSDVPLDLLSLIASEKGTWDYLDEDGVITRMRPGRWGTPRRALGTLPRWIEPSDALMYVIGLYVAEGCLSNHPTQGYQNEIVWTLHENEQETIVPRLQEAITALGGGQLRVYAKKSKSNPDHKGIQVKITHNPLALLLDALVGKGARTKQLHPWLMNLAPKWQVALVEGWCDGDGTITYKGQKSIATSSDIASRQLLDLVQRLGHHPTRIAFKQTGTGTPAYRVVWLEERRKAPYGRYMIDESHEATVVTEMKLEPYDGTVYNFGVFPQESYVAEGRVVHNCGYYLMVSDYCSWAKDHGILVGPGRGSGGGSLVAYLARITSLDPVKHDLLFERFLTMGRAGLPDFDVDFPASKKAEILGYLRQRWGERHVVSIGTEGRLKNKAVLDNVVRALRSQLPEHVDADLKAVKELIKEAEAGTAGLGLSWEDLWHQFGDQLQPYADRYPQVFSMAEKLVGRLKSYGRHAAGVVISTGKPLTDWLPMRTVKGEEQMVTQWAMSDIEAVGLVKFDILTLTTLDVIQGCLDLIAERRGYQVDLEAWEDEFEDPDVWEALQQAHTLGVFQVDTNSGTRLCQRMQPRNIDELADMITIVRPGPMNSGLTDLYLRRRAGEQDVSFPDPRLEQVLGPTWGAAIYQEQIMAICQILAGYDESEADAVRRILGKKKVSAIADAGEEFLSRVDMPHEQAARLWAQMAEFSKYGFNKAHAYGYAFLAFWTSFLKVNYPREFLVGGMSTVDKDKVPSYIKEARRLDIAVLPPDINLSRASFRPDPDQYAIRYGLAIKGVGPAAIPDIESGQPYSSWDDYQTRKGPKANAGVTAALAQVGTFDSLVPNRRGLEAKLIAVKTGEDARCLYKNEDMRASLAIEHPDAPDVCGFDWHTEPAPVNARTGKLLKKKAPPKRCTKACRQYTPQPALQIDDVEPYTAEDIRQIEMDVLGTYLTSTPFDRMDPEDRANALAQAELLTTGPNGEYLLAGIVTAARAHHSHGMGFLNLDTEVSSIRLAVYSELWAAERPRFVTGTLALALVRKTDRGSRLISFQPL